MDKKSLQNTTNLQKIAANPENSAWVFASAGSGKTKILVDRVLRFLLDGVTANKILCVTFTKVAAVEMQERINKKLLSWVMMEEGLLRAEIFELCDKEPSGESVKFARTLFARLLDEESMIKIQTIHAFCQNIVKTFPFEMNVAPNFEILDDKQEKLLIEKAKNEIFLQARFDKDLRMEIAEISAKMSDDAFIDLLSDILSQKERLVFLKERFGKVENIVMKIFLDLGVGDYTSEEAVFDDFVKRIDFTELNEFVAKISVSTKKTDQKTANLLQKFAKNPKLDEISTLREVFYAKSGKKRSKIVTKEFLQEVFVDKMWLLVDEFFDLLNSYKIAQNTAYLLGFVDKILQKYEENKQKNAVLDYNDLIIKTNQLLANPEYGDWVKFRMDGFFDHILIDESQDTNYAQWAIIKALSEDFFSGASASDSKRSLFIIGDDKQSIYGFQGAEANISHEIFDFYCQKNQGIKKVELQNSFRSLPEILQFVDKIFIGNESFEKLEYKSHKPIRQGKGMVEIWPKIESKKQEKDDDSSWKNYATDEGFFGEEFCQKQEMAQLIADKVLATVGKRKIQALDCKEELREVAFGDFMILLRNRANGFDKILQQAFEERDIPSRGAKRVRFSENLLIQDLLAAAKFVLLPEDDLNLACLLKSPFFNFTEVELFEACVVKNESEVTLLEALKLKGDKEILQKLERMQDIAQKNDCYGFFAQIIAEMLDIEAMGSVSDQFLLMVADFSMRNSSNLEKFVEYALKVDPEVSLVDASEDAVVISTIHSAKGLQAPIVILPDCCFNFNKMRAVKQKLFWLDALGDGFKGASLPVWVAKSADINGVVRRKKEQELKKIRDEYWRLFYVALTRAENELYISGFGDDDEDSWYQLAHEVMSVT